MQNGKIPLFQGAGREISAHYPVKPRPADCGCQRGQRTRAVTPDLSFISLVKSERPLQRLQISGSLLPLPDPPCPCDSS